MVNRTETSAPSEIPDAPRPPSPPRFHQARRFNEAPHIFMHDLLREYGDVVCWRGFFDLYLVNNPDAVRQVLSQSFEHYSKKTIDYRVISQTMGNGLVSNDGPHWVHQRKIMQPMFSNRNVNGFDQAINDLTRQLLDQWGGCRPQRTHVGRP